MKKYKIDFDELVDIFPYSDKLKKLKKFTIGFVGFGCAQFSGMFLARCGIQNFIIFDADVFRPTDVSRNLFCFESTIGQHKATISKIFFKDLNPKMHLKVYNKFLTEKNINALNKADVIIDTTGHPSVLKILLDYGKKMKKPITTFRFQGSKGAVSTFLPKERNSLVNRFIDIKAKTKNVHPLLVVIIHALISNEVMKILLGRKDLINFPQIYFIDIKSRELVKIVNFGGVCNDFI
jgi:molybdopterin/thiamine biosynthesis adenylyltransferase